MATTTAMKKMYSMHEINTYCKSLLAIAAYLYVVSNKCSYVHKEIGQWPDHELGSVQEKIIMQT